ncbi:MAG: DUF333 domain-containing protein, partial [Candidatus Aenigmatarchaeota archaeon]
MLKRTILTLSFLFFPLLTFACFNFTDSFAVEVWLNKPGINFDLSFLEKVGEDQLIKKDDALIYRSHFNFEVAVILRKIDEKQLSVKIQIPTKSIETQTGFDLGPAVNIDPNKFNFKEALKSELVWLRENKVINGLSDEDLNLIYEVAERGNAGHNGKIVWDENPQTKKYTWLPYNKTGAPLLLRGGDCGGFSITFLPKKEINIKEKVCRDLCGDGICQEIVCMAVGCPCSESPETCPQDCGGLKIGGKVSIPNPAAIYCEKSGYKLEKRKDKEGNEYGVCVFPDGKECDEWSFYEGKCGTEYRKIDPKEIEKELDKKRWIVPFPIPPVIHLPDAKVEINPESEKPVLIEGEALSVIEEKIPFGIRKLEPNEIPKILVKIQTPSTKETTVQIEIDKEKKLINIENENIVAQTVHPIK